MIDTPSCATCKHFHASLDEKMHAAGFGQCDLEKPYMYRSPVAKCSYYPTRYAALPSGKGK